MSKKKDYKILLKEKIDHFKRGVICVGDEFEIEEDFETGYDKVTKHKKNPDKKP